MRERKEKKKRTECGSVESSVACKAIDWCKAEERMEKNATKKSDWQGCGVKKKTMRTDWRCGIVLKIIWPSPSSCDKRLFKSSILVNEMGWTNYRHAVWHSVEQSNYNQTFFNKSNIIKLYQNHFKNTFLVKYRSNEFDYRNNTACGTIMTVRNN